MTPVLVIPFHRSAALSAAVSLLHLAALCCAVLTLEGWPLALVAMGVALSWVAEFLRQRQWRKQANYLRCHTDGSVQFAPHTAPAMLQSSAMLTPGVAVLRTRDDAGRHAALMLAADSVPPTGFRRLRVWLRWHRCTSSPFRD